MSAQTRYLALQDKRRRGIRGVCFLLILEMFVLGMYFHPEYFRDAEQYTASLTMDGAITLGLLIGLASFFLRRKALRVSAGLSVIPIMAWFFFACLPYAKHLAMLAVGK